MHGAPYSTLPQPALMKQTRCRAGTGLRLHWMPHQASLPCSSVVNCSCRRRMVSICACTCITRHPAQAAGCTRTCQDGATASGPAVAGGRADCLWYKVPLTAPKTQQQSQDALTIGWCVAAVALPALCHPQRDHAVLGAGALPAIAVCPADQPQAQGGRHSTLVACLLQEGVLLSLHLGHHLILSLQGNQCLFSNHVSVL